MEQAKKYKITLKGAKKTGKKVRKIKAEIKQLNRVLEHYIELKEKSGL